VCFALFALGLRYMLYCMTRQKEKKKGSQTYDFPEMKDVMMTPGNAFLKSFLFYAPRT
jgi:hypothetical protein